MAGSPQQWQSSHLLSPDSTTQAINSSRVATSGTTAACSRLPGLTPFAATGATGPLAWGLAAASAPAGGFAESAGPLSAWLEAGLVTCKQHRYVSIWVCMYIHDQKLHEPATMDKNGKQCNNICPRMQAATACTTAVCICKDAQEVTLEGGAAFCLLE